MINFNQNRNLDWTLLQYVANSPNSSSSSSSSSAEMCIDSDEISLPPSSPLSSTTGLIVSNDLPTVSDVELRAVIQGMIPTQSTSTGAAASPSPCDCPLRERIQRMILNPPTSAASAALPTLSDAELRARIQGMISTSTANPPNSHSVPTGSNVEASAASRTLSDSSTGSTSSAASIDYVVTQNPDHPIMRARKIPTRRGTITVITFPSSSSTSSSSAATSAGSSSSSSNSDNTSAPSGQKRRKISHASTSSVGASAAAAASDTTTSVSRSHSSTSSSENDDELTPQDLRRKTNRICARNYRIKSQNYLENLEARVRELTLRNLDLERQISSQEETMSDSPTAAAMSVTISYSSSVNTVVRVSASATQAEIRKARNRNSAQRTRQNRLDYKMGLENLVTELTRRNGELLRISSCQVMNSGVCQPQNSTSTNAAAAH